MSSLNSLIATRQPWPMAFGDNLRRYSSDGLQIVGRITMPLAGRFSYLALTINGVGSSPTADFWKFVVQARMPGKPLTDILAAPMGWDALKPGVPLVFPVAALTTYYPVETVLSFGVDPGAGTPAAIDAPWVSALFTP